MLAERPELLRDDVARGLPDVPVNLAEVLSAGSKDFVEIGMDRAYNGSPARVVVVGPTAELMAARGVSQVVLSTAFCREFATATAIAVRASISRPAEDTALDD